MRSNFARLLCLPSLLLLAPMAAMASEAPAPMDPSVATVLPTSAQAQERHKVRFDVRLPDGTAPESAKVLIRLAGGVKSYVWPWTSVDEAVRLLKGKGTLIVTSDFYDEDPGRPAVRPSRARFSSEPVPFDVKTIGEQPVAVALEPTTVLVVKLPDGLKLRENYRPNLVLQTPEAAAERMLFGLPQPGRTHRAVQDALFLGRKFYLFGLEEGDRWVVGLGVKGRASSYETVVLGPGETTLNCVWQGLKMPEEVAVRCVDASGTPVKLQRIGTKARLGSRTATQSFVQWKTGERDRRVFDGFDLDPALPWPMLDRREAQATMVIVSKSHGTIILPLDAETAEYEVVFREPKTLEVSLAADWPLPTTLRVTHTGADSIISTQLAVEDGTFEALLLQPGSYEVDLVLCDPARRDGRKIVATRYGLVLARKTVIVGRQPLDAVVFERPALHPARFHINTTAARTSISIARIGLDDSQTGRLRIRQNADGPVDFGNLPAGEYRIHLGPWFESIIVELPATETKFAPRAFKRIEVVDCQAYEPLRRAGLRNEDVIIGVEGEVFETAEAARTFLSFAREDTTGLLVERAGERLELELDQLKSVEGFYDAIKPR